MKQVWRMRWLLVGLLVLFLTATAGILLLQSGSEPVRQLSESEIRDQVLGQYGGEIREVQSLREGYQVTLESELGVYELLLGGAGEARRILRLEAFEPPEPVPNPGGEPGQPGTDQPEEPGGEEPPPLPLTEEEAIKIALGQVLGKVEDVELRSNDNGIYYLIEIETPEEREAVIQVNAITGTVISVIWDDDDDT
ncbi:PepSY domain-containing protein [Paenibacillus daejeonensis]|uniref:PepSY domain-containing protein n=1 Tax=Paenibacillus daejeonensis TaxID=135193 RepID=UPI00036D926B|nr:PepSY domain-containing protein [Paenibacillus daejeonensis]